MVIKCYYGKARQHFRGQDRETWTAAWRRVDIAQAARGADRDRLAPLFRRYFPRPPQRILEGGCGTGKYVIAYRRLGYDIIGVDFSSETVARIKAFDPALPVACADVCSLPFEDGFFHCYYSGGVLEHFEAGPRRLLGEAHRVLAPGGLLLATVPYVNVLRRLGFVRTPAALQTRALWYAQRGECRTEPPPEGYNFAEYLFELSELRQHFRANAFRVERVHHCDLLHGEVGLALHQVWLRLKSSSGGRRGRSKGSPESGQQCGDGASASGWKGVVRQVFVGEDPDHHLLRCLVRSLGRLAGHMVAVAARAV